MSRPICVIDDDEDVRGVLCFALEFEGLKALSFSSGPEAEAVLSTLSEDELPGMIVVDYMMPEMDGVQFITHMMEDYPETIGRIPMALSTARFEDETSDLPDRAMRLEKPVDLKSFITLAKKYAQADSHYTSHFPL
jgi:CheY-like chemotaxis protein